MDRGSLLQDLSFSYWFRPSYSDRREVWGRTCPGAKINKKEKQCKGVGMEFMYSTRFSQLPLLLMLTFSYHFYLLPCCRLYQ